MVNRLEQSKDYLQRKLENKAYYEGLAGATEQDRFDNLSTDEEKIEAISFNNVSDSVAVPFLMGLYSLDLTNASNMFGGMVLKSIEENAKACKARFENKSNGWFPILFTFFSQETAQGIIDAVRDYLNDYCEYAKFGMNYGDAERGIFDFIDNTNGVITSLIDYPLKAEHIVNNNDTDYIPVQTALKTYFRG